MAAHGMADNFTALESYYVQRNLNIVAGLGKSPIGWQEIFDNQLQLPNSTVVHVWKNPFSAGQQELARVTAAGFKALLSAGWYLNYEAYVSGGQWTTYYNNDPLNFTGMALFSSFSFSSSSFSTSLFLSFATPPSHTHTHKRKCARTRHTHTRTIFCSLS